VPQLEMQREGKNRVSKVNVEVLKNIAYLISLKENYIDGLVLQKHHST